jgi:hypothetical protein
MDFQYQTDDEKQKLLSQFLQAQEQARKMMQPSNAPDMMPQYVNQGDMNSPEANISPYVSAIGTGGYGNNIASGFGQIRGNIPIDENTTISPYAGGAGVRGSAGGQRLGLFMPQFGVNLSHKF